jgi:hypothetical protein
VSIPSRERIRTRVLLGALLVASAVIRVPLVWAPGHNYWPDEGLYRGFMAAAVHGDGPAMRAALSDDGHHFLYRIAWILPDAIEYLIKFERTPTFVFGTVSVVCVWLVYGIARRGGASPSEALVAAALMAASNTMFYYSRHFFPYDLALALALGGLFIGLGSSRVISPLFAGVFAALAIVMYPGYWTMAITVVPLAALGHAIAWTQRLRRIAHGAVGGLLALAVCQLAYQQLTGGSLLRNFGGYAGTILQGSFSEGWSLPFEYLWYAEHGLLVLWCVALAVGVWWWMSSQLPLFIRGCLGSVALMYGLWVIGSNVLERFVVYGRLVRPIVPYLCVVSAAIAARSLPATDRWRRTSVTAGTALVLIQAAGNMWTPLHLQFPRGFRGDNAPRVAQVAEPDYRWLNVRHLYPGPENQEVPDGWEVIAEAPHPLQFSPYLFEGYTPQERAILRGSDVRMRLIVRMGAIGRNGTVRRPIPAMPVRRLATLSFSRRDGRGDRTGPAPRECGDRCAEDAP